MLEPSGDTLFTRCAMGIEHAYRVFSAGALEFVFDKPGLRAMRPDSQEQSVSIAKQPIAPGLVRPRGFAVLRSELAHDALRWVGNWVGIWVGFYGLGWD